MSTMLSEVSLGETNGSTCTSEGRLLLLSELATTVQI